MSRNTATTKQLTPLFNTSALELELGNLTLVEGLWRPLETLLPKGVPVQIIAPVSGPLCAIETPAYPSQTPLYIHRAFLRETPESQTKWERPPLPSLSIFLSRINWCLKKRTPYLWGGNAPKGTHSLSCIYNSPLHRLNQQEQRIWKLEGVDCSGLIYWATRGATGRNTSDLIREGTGVKIEGLSNEQIAAQLKPGMLIVWKGHVLVVTAEGIVDSTPEKGVSCTPILEKIRELMQKRIPIDAWPLSGNPAAPSFVVRNLYNKIKF